MKTYKLLIVITATGLLFSCHNNSESTSSQSTDSVKTTDTAVLEKPAMGDPELDSTRAIYRREMQRELDSMTTSYNYMDSMSMSHKSKVHKDWDKTKVWFNARRDSLRNDMDDAKATSKSDWEKFKMKMDTARSKFKRDWNKSMEKMKFKK